MAGEGRRHQQEQRDESEAERLDRNYGELLQEMRVLQAGVQILFAFLLSLPFQSRFESVTDFQRNTYLVTIVSAALATALVIGPVPFHRVVYRRGMKADLMRVAARYIAGGLAFFFVSMTGAVLLVLDFLVSRTFAVGVVAALAAGFLVLWVVVPFLSRAERDADDHGERRA